MDNETELFLNSVMDLIDRYTYIKERKNYCLRRYVRAKTSEEKEIWDRVLTNCDYDDKYYFNRIKEQIILALQGV